MHFPGHRVSTVTMYMKLGLASTGYEVSTVTMQVSVPSLPGLLNTSRLVLILVVVV